MRPRPLVLVTLAASFGGLFFSGFSTFDFVAHLDRQVHELHCSFIPGLAHTEASGSGCHVALMSPYSSVLRATFWGGIPISLPAMSVFSFLAFWSAYVTVTRRDRDVRATAFLAVATVLPVLSSLVMATISFTTLHAFCKLCIGIYLSSSVAFGCALAAWRLAKRGVPRATISGAADTMPEGTYDPRDDPYSPPMPLPTLGAAFALGLAFVLVPVSVYAATLPDYAHFVGTCGTLPHPEDPYGVMVAVDGPVPGATPAVEVLDPLCPSCRAFETRLAASGLDRRMVRKVVLFPLDKPCNWMVDEAVHPGSCVVSEAVLCAGDDARDVIAWAFENQDGIKEAAAHDPHAAERMVRDRFPALASCIGSPLARARLDRSLRWTVQNRLPVLTPQLYVGGRKLCDEDTDLGMDYALSRMLDRGAH